MHAKTLLLAIVAAIGFNQASSTCFPNQQPVIGILAQPLNENSLPGTNYITASYVKFVEMFGGRVVPILPKKPLSYYQFLAERLNGVILPGGEVDLYTGEYHKMAKIFYDYSLEFLDKHNETFPLMGTCLGFESMATFAAHGEVVIDPTDSVNLLSTIEFTKYGEEESEVFSLAPEWLINGLKTNNIAANFHQYSLLKETYDKNLDIQRMFEAVGYSYDRQGLKYVTMMEGKRYPLLALQHHPEKNLFEWTQFNYAHNFLGSAYGQYMSAYFVQKCRSSCHYFDSEEQLAPFLIWNYPVTYTNGMFMRHFTQMYLFPENDL